MRSKEPALKGFHIYNILHLPVKRAPYRADHLCFAYQLDLVGTQSGGDQELKATTHQLQRTLMGITQVIPISHVCSITYM